MANTVIGLFDDSSDAEQAVRVLKERGFASEQISIVATDRDGQYRKHSVDDEGNVIADGAVSGLTSGAVVGGFLGVLIGTGAILLPGGVLVAGPIAGFLAGATAGAATGGVLGALIGMGIPKEHANVYAEAVERGGTLVTVGVEEDRVEEAEQLLTSCGAANVEERAEEYRREGAMPSPTPVTTEQAEIERNAMNLSPGSVGLTIDPTGTGTAPSAISGLPADHDGRREPYEGFSPAYEFGFAHAQDKRLEGRVWDQVERELREEWELRLPGSWAMYREAIHVGWDRCRVRGPNGGKAELI